MTSKQKAYIKELCRKHCGPKCQNCQRVITRNDHVKYHGLCRQCHNLFLSYTGEAAYVD